MAATDEVGGFIRHELTDGSVSISEEDDLLETGILDSAGMAQLLAFLEDRYDIAIEDDELAPERFGSIAAINAFVAEKRSAS